MFDNKHLILALTTLVVLFAAFYTSASHIQSANAQNNASAKTNTTAAITKATAAAT
jgi:hypothetical protein